MTEQPIRPPVDDALPAIPSVSNESEADRTVVDSGEVAAATLPEVTAVSDETVVLDETVVSDETGTEKPPEPQPAKKRVPPQAVVARLAEAWPQAFFHEPRSVKPLAIGTLQQILANRPDALDGLNSQAIRTGIKFYTSRLSYHYGMVNNTHRITLSGEAVDEVDDKAREYAKAQIVAIQQQRAAQRAAQNPASAEEGAAGDDAASAPRRPSRSKRAAPKRAQPQTTESTETPSGSEGVSGAASENSGKAHRPARSNTDRSRSGRRPRPPADTSTHQSSGTAGAEPALSLEEKLARLAAHFGKPSS